MAFDLIKKLTCIWTQISIFPRASTLHRDRISAASMGPAGKLINIRQGEGSIEEHAGCFWEVARRSATEKTCLLVFFWGRLAEPLRARMPYWNPEDSLEGYLNLALRLSGSAFRVELAANPVRDSSQVAASAPEAAVPAHTAHEAPSAAMPAHRASEVAVPAPTAPEAAVPALTAHEAPNAARPAHTAPEAAVSAPTGEPTESAPDPAAFSSGPSSTTWACPPPSLPLLSPCPAVPLVGGSGTSGSRSFKGGGVVSGVQAQRPPSLCQRAPPPFLLDSSLHSTHLCTHSSLHSTHLCTYSSLSAVPNVWTIYAPQLRPSACRDYIYQHSHVHVCISLCLLSDRLHSVSCTRVIVFVCWLLI